jgi:WD40 repeat protein
MVAVYDLENALSVWNIKTQKLINRLNLHMSVINSIAFSPDNRLLITGNTDKVARIWDISNGTVIRVLSGHTGPVTDVVFVKDGKKIITASQDGTIRTWVTDYNDLIDYACSRIGIDLSQADRTNYGITDQEPTCPQFGSQSIPPLPTTTPMPTHELPAIWTPMPTPTKNAGN